MNHTPGPWIVDDLNIFAGDQWVADCDPMDSDLLTPENTIEANARLIAAAPELLEFVQLVIDASEQGITLAQLQQVAKKVIDGVAGPTEGGI